MIYLFSTHIFSKENYIISPDELFYWTFGCYHIEFELEIFLYGEYMYTQNERNISNSNRTSQTCEIK